MTGQFTTDDLIDLHEAGISPLETYVRPIPPDQRAAYERALRWELAQGITAHQLPPEGSR